ncbi:DUF4232 domain-containing protein [Burkholderia dolosa]|uniref:PF07007 family protein n=1 Tax=Burkholderia dolosa TaxID=152500 RepID=A0A892I611_9BURK|nr:MULTISPECIES: DUF4232 domain-containing protein [Burkholderia]AJY14630.1 hypothetical protein AK34_1223 [Burkholderia dolosa AU0158]MBR8417397.1 hypothetical protein [Burkholderia dolosa]MBY4656616.1 DUF4232 domain-containing protein [Burkholderia dolosa]MBY4689078.1 DUF4232 domain-containing protein [Burkholderia dolosa]MBY4780513.1 DUF4232 domain-containing protein [Burkholderia dolosa]
MKPIAIGTSVCSLSALALTLLFQGSAVGADATPGQPSVERITPHCGAADGPALANADTIAAGRFAKAVCPRPEILGTLKRIDTLAQRLMPQLQPAWRATLNAQQAAFAQTANNCPSDQAGLARCLADAIDQRLKDLEDLQAGIEDPAPPCTSADVSIVDAHAGDAGMSHQFSAWLFRYHGSSRCRISGYPAIAVSDVSGRPRPSLAVYSGNTYFAQMTGTPLPVTLSAANRSAWFGIETASACDPPSSLTVKVALPGSTTWLHTLSFPYANCAVTVTPVAAMSTLHAFLQ